jgi:malonyl-CoA O-methyltransferase
MLSRKEIIAGAFGRQASHYDSAATLQRQSAAALVSFLPEGKKNILEIGCGTGFLTDALAARYPGAAIHAIDISPQMIAYCHNKLNEMQNIKFSTQDGESLNDFSPYDLLCSNFAIQWFADPLTFLDRIRQSLNPSAAFYYAVPAQGSMKEWSDILQHAGWGQGALTYPDWPGIIKEEKIEKQYDSAHHFLKTLKEIGAATPRDGYRPLNASDLRQAMRLFDEGPRKITWRIAYGKITA